MAKTLITSLIPMASLSYQCIGRLRELHKGRKPLGQQQLVPPNPQKRRTDGNSLSLPKFQWCLQSLTKEGRPCRPMLPPVRWSLSKRVVVAAKEACQTVKVSQKKEGRQEEKCLQPKRGRTATACAAKASQKKEGHAAQQQVSPVAGIRGRSLLSPGLAALSEGDEVLSSCMYCHAKDGRFEILACSPKSKRIYIGTLRGASK